VAVAPDPGAAPQNPDLEQEERHLMRIPTSITARAAALVSLALVAALATLLAGGFAPAVAQQGGSSAVGAVAATAAEPATVPAGGVARGEYLVHYVAMCVQCHTPRTAGGELDTSRLLEGAPVPLASPYPNRPWALVAPSLAGLAPWSEEQIVTLLTTGARPDGQVPRPPMPPFRMSRQDAEAVVAYLKSVH
jgi:mono/diheme cytochrome c family protein